MSTYYTANIMYVLQFAVTYWPIYSRKCQAKAYLLQLVTYRSLFIK